MLEDVRAVADVVVDTSAMTVHELRSFIQKTFVGDPESARDGRLGDVLRLQVRHAPRRGPALRRALPGQPHFVPELKGKTGMDPAVAAYIEKDPETAPFLERLTEFLDYLLPRFDRERKSYLSIGIGCTGGKHRSVYIAERLAELPQGAGVPRPRLPPRRHARMR